MQPHEPSAASSARISQLSGAEGGKRVVSAPRLGWEPIPSRQAPGWLQQQRGPRGHSQGVIWVLGEAEAAPAPLRSGRALTLELAGCCLEAGIWCSEAIFSWAVCF